MVKRTTNVLTIACVLFGWAIGAIALEHSQALDWIIWETSGLVDSL